MTPEQSEQRLLVDKLNLSKSAENQIEEKLGRKKEWDEPEEMEEFECNRACYHKKVWGNYRNESTAQEGRRCYNEQMEW